MFTSFLWKKQKKKERKVTTTKNKGRNCKWVRVIIRKTFIQIDIIYIIYYYIYRYIV